MTLLTKVGIAAAALAAAFLLGKYTAPEKIITQVKTVEVEKKVVDTTKTTNKRVTSTVTTKPDGTKEEKTVTEDIVKDETKNTTTDKTSVSKTEERTKESGKTTISALAGTKLDNLSSRTYGGSISRRVLGPLSVTATGFTDGTVAAGIGVSF